MNPRILIAEDDEFNQLVLRDMLMLIVPGAEIHVVEDGRAAYERLRAERWDLLLTDIDMPEMDGTELLAAARRDLGLEVPIVAVTAFAVVGDRERLLMHGFDDYVAKPIDLDRIAEVAGRYLTPAAAEV
ncbi:response regulator [bacterium]|nr:response regulator [bacterium]